MSRKHEVLTSNTLVDDSFLSFGLRFMRNIDLLRNLHNEFNPVNLVWFPSELGKYKLAIPCGVRECIPYH